MQWLNNGVSDLVVVLSLFDGISCGRVALERAGIKVSQYYASEIDKHAIEISKKNHPDIIHLGDVKNWREWDLPKIDLIIGGSPCQGFSFAGKKLNFDDPRSKLYFEFLACVRHFKPKHFLLENVKMRQDFRDIISKDLSVEAVLINSNLLSAQNRPRYYWTNITFETPDDLNVGLRSVIERGVSSEYHLPKIWDEWVSNNPDFDVDKQKPFAMTERRTEESKRIRREHMKKHGVDFSPRRGKELWPRSDEKMNCLTATYSVKEHSLVDEDSVYRKLTPIECERLQTLPDNYTEGISNSQRYKALGNGWTVDVIAHILRGI